MTPAEEDALATAIETQWIAGGTKSVRDIVRLAIRAAVAAERERCAKVAEQSHPHDWPFIAAAIRKGGQ